MNIDQTFIHCASPAMCGIKPANLFSIRKQVFENSKNSISQTLKKWKIEFESIGMNFICIERSDNLLLFFVYRKTLLEKSIFSSKWVNSYLRKKNYPVKNGLDAIIQELSKRLSVQKDFPHEVGIFLGYPICDVIAFEQKIKSESKFNGYWKVYSKNSLELKKAKALSNLYKNCSEICLQMFKKGIELQTVVFEYRQKFTKQLELIA